MCACVCVCVCVYRKCIFILQAVLIAPFFVWFSSSKGIYYTSQNLERFSTFERKSCLEQNPCHHCSEFRDRSQSLSSLRCDIVLPQQKVRKCDHVRSTCVLVGLKDVQRFSVHLLLVSFGHCRPLAASQEMDGKTWKYPTN